jgi:hypothetical protein
MSKKPRLLINMRLEYEGELENCINATKLKQFLYEKVRDKFPLCYVNIGEIEVLQVERDHKK